MVSGSGISIFGSAIAVNPGAGLTLDGSLVTIDTAVVPRKYAATLSTSATSYVVTHNLGTRDVQVQVTEASSPYGTVVTAWGGDEREHHHGVLRHGAVSQPVPSVCDGITPWPTSSP